MTLYFIVVLGWGALVCMSVFLVLLRTKRSVGRAAAVGAGAGPFWNIAGGIGLDGWIRLSEGPDGLVGMDTGIPISELFAAALLGAMLGTVTFGVWKLTAIAMKLVAPQNNSRLS